MDLWDTLGIFWRRWYVVVPILALTAAAVVLTSGRVAADYRATATILLVAPGEVVPTEVLEIFDPEVSGGASGDEGEGDDELSPGGANQYVDFPGSLRTMAEATALSAGSQATVTRVREAGGTADLGIGVLPGTPIIEVTATDRVPAEAVETMDLAVEAVSSDLGGRQSGAGIPERAWITAQVLNRPEAALADGSSRIRVRVAILLLGIMVAFAAAIAVEGLAQRRQRAAEARRAPSDSDRLSALVSLALGEPVTEGDEDDLDPERAADERRSLFARDG
jgi:hypothetical protein